MVTVLFYLNSHQTIDSWRRGKADYAIQVIPSAIPCTEQKILCATFLEAALRFYEDPANEAAFEQWLTEKGGVTYAKAGGK